MARLMYAYRRTSNRYAPGWAHLDGEEYMGFSIKVVYGKAQWDTDKNGFTPYDAGFKRWVYLTASKPVTRDEMLDTLHKFNKGCRCEHDCCGCFNGGAYSHTLKRIGRNGRRWAVILSYSPNL